MFTGESSIGVSTGTYPAVLDNSPEAVGRRDAHAATSAPGAHAAILGAKPNGGKPALKRF